MSERFSTRRKVAVFVIAAVIVAFVGWLSTGSAKADPGIPANGYVSHGKCYVVIGQGGFSQQVSCRDFNLAPKPVRRAVAIAAACAVAAILDEPVTPACIGGVVGWVPFAGN